MSHYYKLSHAMMLDEPIGYAHSGPPMQKKVIAQSLEKSKGLGMVIGVVAGIATAGAGWAAWGAAQAGSLAAVSAGAMMAGGVMTAVGAVTQNKKLTKIGGVLSLAGGLGTVVSKAGGIGGVIDNVKSSASDAMASVSKAWSGATESLGTGLSGGSVSPNIGLDAVSGAGSVADGAAGAAGAGIDTVASSAADSTGILAGKFSSTAPNIGVSGGMSLAPESAGFSVGQGALSGPVSTPISSSYGITGGNLGLSTGSSAQTLGLGMDGAVGAGVASGSIGGPGLANMATTAGGSASQIASANKGILGKAWDFAGTPQGMNLMGNMAQGAMSGEGEAQAAQVSEYARQFDQKMLAEEMSRQRANNLGSIYYNPNDPNAQKIIAAAQQAGIKAQPLTINTNANVQSPTSAFKGATV